jgi:hypothetical protein
MQKQTLCNFLEPCNMQNGAMLHQASQDLENSVIGGVVVQKMKMHIELSNGNRFGSFLMLSIRFRHQ